MANPDSDREIIFPSAWTWLPWILLEIILVSLFANQLMTSRSLNDAIGLFVMTFCLGWELFRKTTREKEYYAGRISFLEKQIENRMQELATQREKQ